MVLLNNHSSGLTAKAVAWLMSMSVVCDTVTLRTMQLSRLPSTNTSKDFVCLQLSESLHENLKNTASGSREIAATSQPPVSI